MQEFVRDSIPVKVITEDYKANPSYIIMRAKEEKEAVTRRRKVRTHDMP